MSDFLFDTSAFRAVSAAQLASISPTPCVSPFCFWEILSHLEEPGEFDKVRENLGDESASVGRESFSPRYIYLGDFNYLITIRRDGIYTIAQQGGNMGSRPWKQHLIDFFGGLHSEVFFLADLTRLIDENRQDLKLPKSYSAKHFIEIALEAGVVQKLRLIPDEAPYSATSFTRYVIGTPPPYAIGLSLKRNSYLSHASAIFMHGLTEQIPRTIYVNREQSPKPKPGGGLTQEGITRAFRRKPRRSRYALVGGEWRHILLSGKNTGNLGVEPLSIPGFHRSLPTTNIERTLIDIVVRPFYAGGLIEVARAFRGARERISVNKLCGMIGKLDYVYPYHQAIGFLMEQVGYSEGQLDLMRTLPIDFDFYLDYGMGETSYDPAWRIYSPANMRFSA